MQQDPVRRFVAEGLIVEYGPEDVAHVSWEIDREAANRETAKLWQAARLWRERLLLEEELDCVMRTPTHHEWAVPLDPRIVRLLPGGARFRPPKRPDSTDVDRDRDLWHDLDPDAWLRTDFLARGGWTITNVRDEHAAPVGRPRHKGLKGEMLLAAIRKDLPYTIETMRAACGKKDKRSRAIRDHVALWLVWRGNIDRGDFAVLVGYRNRRQVDRLHEKGRKMLELLEQINGKLDLLIGRLRDDFDPPPDDIPAAIEAFLSEVLSDAA